MDDYALQLANLLVGNPPHEAALEVTMTGLTVLALHDQVIAITGGNLSPQVDGQAKPLWESFLLKKGEILSFTRPLSGARAYLSVAGGFDVPPVMGSRSTFLRAQLGGFQGRALQSGDHLSGRGSPDSSPPVLGKRPPPSSIPRYEKNITLRVIAGPDLAAFTQEGIQNFYRSSYTVTSQSDRMGYRLKGPAVTLIDKADILSEAVPFGAIQIPGDGLPLILMADRQTTGGYARIGTVITVDIPLLAQALPGNTLRFQEFPLKEAQWILRERIRGLQNFREDQ